MIQKLIIKLGLLVFLASLIECQETTRKVVLAPLTERIKTLSNITSLPVILGPQVLPDARSVSRTKRILNPSQLPFSSGSVIRLRPVGYSEDDDDGDYDGEDDRMISKPKIGRLYLRCQYTRQ